MTTPAPGSAVLEAREWGWRHSGRRDWALQNVSVEIEPGERVLLLGASGAGKSTLLHGWAGVLGGDDEGEQRGILRVAGADPRGARGRAGLVLQDPDAQVILSRVGDDVAFGCENLGVPREEIWARVDAAVDAVGLAVPRSHPTAALSGGQKQRLALAGVLAMEPSVVLLDEPTANLDPQGARDVRDAVDRSLALRGGTLVVVEHRIELWLPIITRVIVIAEGTVIADGSPDAVLHRHAEALRAQGVWVPGTAVAAHIPTAPTGELLEAASALAVGRAGAPVAADAIDLPLHAGETVALTGPNGSGKTTLALTLAGLLPPREGTVRASPALAAGLGPDPGRWRSRELVTRIGMVFQEPEHQLLGRTVREELEIGIRAAGRSDPARVDELLSRLRLDHLAAANPFTLSGGEKRRLTVAAMLAAAPRLLILDEPTFGQDARTWAELIAVLAELRDDGAGLCVVTHDEDIPRALGARRLVLPARAERDGESA